MRNLEAIHALFSFDNDMRGLLLGVIEIIETQMKSQYIQNMLKIGGPYCLLGAFLDSVPYRHAIIQVGSCPRKGLQAAPVYELGAVKLLVECS